MYKWPLHYPPSCPPEDAVELVGRIFRFINGADPTERDFVAYYERNPEKDWGSEACKARGLSVMRTWKDCKAMRQGVPALRRKNVAVAEIHPASGVGLIKATPSSTCKGHCTWWRALNPGDVIGLFSLFIENMEATDE